MCGTPEYGPPEVFRREEYTKSFDWWSLGIILYELLSGSNPFYLAECTNNVWDCYVEVEKLAKKYPHLEFPLGIDRRAEELLLQLLHPCASCRAGTTAENTTAVTTAPFFATQDWGCLSRQEASAPAVL